MKCPKCNRDNNDYAQVCIYCNSPLPNAKPPQPEPKVRISKLAVASAVFGLVGPPCFFIYYRAAMAKWGPREPEFGILFLILTILAVLIGIVALVRIETHCGLLTGKGFAATGIALPVASFFLITLFVALTIPRSTAVTNYCTTNLSGIGKAILIYANDYDDGFPRAGLKYGPAVWNAANAQEAYKNGAGITSNFYLLVKYAEITPKQFLCRGDAGTVQYVNANTDLAALFDFGPNPSKHCSYTYHFPYGERPLTTSSDPGMAVAADRNPWLPTPGREARSAKEWNRFHPDGDRKSIKLGNAFEHQDEGQHTLFVDAHTSFEKRPFCGVNEDNIYTSQNAQDIKKGLRPTITSQPANNTDSLLLHDPPKGANK